MTEYVYRKYLKIKNKILLILKNHSDKFIYK